MPTDDTIHPELRRARSSASEVLTGAESEEHCERMSAEPDFQPDAGSPRVVQASARPSVARIHA